MWRIRIAIRSSLIPAGGQLLGCGPPEVKRRDHICARFGWHIKAPTDGSGSFSPREKDGWRVFDDGTLECGNPLLVFGVVARMSNPIERGINSQVSVVAVVERRTRVPEEIRPDQIWPLNEIREKGVEVAMFQPTVNLIRRHCFQVQINANGPQLSLEGQCQSFMRGIDEDAGYLGST
jgi:hypothetical protein